MSDDFLAYLHELFADFGPITTRAMFGGHGVYFEGLIIGIVIDDALYLKADARDASRRSRPPAARLSSTTAEGAADRRCSYWSLPDEAMDSPQAMLPWARLRVRGGAAQAAGAPKRASRLRHCA